MPTPEIPIDKQVQERPTEVISETLAQAGVTPTPSNVKPVYDDKGKPITSTPASNSTTIQIPADTKSLVAKAKGKITDAATWLARFFLRMIAKERYANNNDDND